MNRRSFNHLGLRSLTAGLLLGSVIQARPAKAAPSDSARSTAPPSQAVLKITVYRDPACGCCHKWVNYLEQQGFQVTDIVRSDMATVKQQHGVPDDLASCHTAIVEGYVVEGHVPAADIQRLVTERPDIKGIAVPGMPVGSPGMESGDRQDAFVVVAFGPGRQTTTFNRYGADQG
ncbi:MAG TPA: DUF411 domain-containing protein [Leptolyngbyaceae cyanobacterium]